MRRVLLIDDDTIVRIGIKSMLDWEKYGFAFVGEAEDGESGFEAYRELHPDIILCDVKMPRLNGIELVRRIRITDRNVKIVMLSYHGDFDFVKEALLCGANDYYLKISITPEELLSVLTKQIETLDTNISTRPLMTVSKKQCLIEELVKVSPDNKASFPEDVHSLNISEKNLYVICIALDNYKKVTQTHTFDEKNAFVMSIRAILEQTFQICPGFEVACLRENLFTVILNLPPINVELLEEHNLKRLLDIARYNIKKFTNLTISMGVSQQCNSISQLPSAFRDARKALSGTFFTGPDNILMAKEIKETVKMPIEYIKELEGKASRAIGTNSFEELSVLFDDAQNLFSQRVYSAEEVRFFAEYIANILINEHIKRFPVHTVSSLFLDDLHAASNLIDLFAVLKQQVEKTKTAAVQSRKYHPLINKLIKYIDVNYSDTRLSLPGTARYLGISTGYLSALIKKELSLTFSDYLNTFRVEKACEMLNSTDLKIYEISEAVGFNNLSYFLRTFKQQVGASPKDYRYSSLLPDPTE